MKKIICKKCVRTCCDGMEIRREDQSKGVDPRKLDVGSLLVVQGIIWKKLESGLWRCIAFDPKKRSCKIWRYRPHVCRMWNCGLTSTSKYKEVSNLEEVKDLHNQENYGLHFSIAPSDLMKRPYYKDLKFQSEEKIMNKIKRSAEKINASIPK